MQADDPNQNTTFNYDRESLPPIWERMHGIDQEPLPTPQVLDALLKRPGVRLEQVSPEYGDDVEGLSDALLDAWVAFHNGDYEGAAQQGRACGAVAGYVTYLAENSYASYRAPETERTELFLKAASGARECADVLPGEINIEYIYAMNMGRYTEGISTAKAVSSGAAKSFKQSLETCLEIRPDHIPSLIAQGAFYAQVISGIGELAAKVSFGATRKKVYGVFEKALEMPSPLAVVYLEYAKNRLLLEPKKRKEAITLLEQAIVAPVLDPLDVFDQQEARALLRQLS